MLRQYKLIVPYVYKTMHVLGTILCPAVVRPDASLRCGVPTTGVSVRYRIRINGASVRRGEDDRETGTRTVSNVWTPVLPVHHIDRLRRPNRRTAEEGHNARHGSTKKIIVLYRLHMASRQWRAESGVRSGPKPIWTPQHLVLTSKLTDRRVNFRAPS